MLEAHNLAAQMLASVNAQLIERGLLLKTGTVVDATLIAAPTSTKNSTGERDPEMHQTKKGRQWHHGMKAHKQMLLLGWSSHEFSFSRRFWATYFYSPDTLDGLCNAK